MTTMNDQTTFEGIVETMKIDGRVDEMVRLGKISQGYAERMRALLLQAARAGLEKEFLEIAELLPEKFQADAPVDGSLTAREAAFYRKHFPDLDLEAIRKAKQAQTW